MPEHNDLNENLIGSSSRVPYDARFVNHNVMKHCWLNYLQFQNCYAANPDNLEECARFGAYVQNRCVRQMVCPTNATCVDV